MAKTTANITVRLDPQQAADFEATVRERLAEMADAPAVEQLRLDQYTGPWLVEERRFADALAHIRGMNLVEHVRESRAAAENESGNGKRRRYELGDDGVAIVELSGFMTKYSGSFSTGTVSVARALREADADAAVKGIVLRIDSGGGSVSGVDDLAKTVAALKKPVAAFIWGFGASAAYWAASGADRIVANESAYVGSIGVYTVVEDWSKAFEAEGVRVHVIRAGQFKGAGTIGTEITEEQMANWQRTVDAIHADFTAAVARGRGLSLGRVTELADGRIHPAKEAQALGLIDETAHDDVEALARARAAALGEKRRSVRGSKRQNGGGAASADHEPAPGGGERENTTMTGENGKPAAGGTETGTKSAPQPATLKELKAALPKADNDFLVECCEKDYTVAQAKDAYVARLEAANETAATQLKKAQEDAAKATAKAGEAAPGPKKPGVAPVASGGGKAESEDDPITAWNKAIDAEMQVTKDRARAIANVVARDPELHERYLEAYNARAGRPGLRR